MQKFKFICFAMSALVMFSCKKSQTTVTATTVQISVTDGVNNDAATAATVYLYDSADALSSNTPKYTGTTDQNGKVTITVAYTSQYLVVAQKGVEKNYFSGLIPIGIFTSATEIADSPIQTPAAVVGDVKFLDTNGDGMISSQDDVTAPAISITAKTSNAFATTIY